MARKIFVVAAALALAGGAWAQGGGGAGGGGGGGSGAGAESGGHGSGGGGAQGTGSASEDASNQAAARQQAPSVTNVEGAGGHLPNPVAEGKGEDGKYGNAPPQRAGPDGRPANEPNAGAQAGAAGAAPDARSQVTGRVALVIEQDRELAIDAGSSTTQVKVARDAKISVDGKQASFKDIPKGAEVRASLDRSGDEPQAKTVEVTSAAKKK